MPSGVPEGVPSGNESGDACYCVTSGNKHRLDLGPLLKRWIDETSWPLHAA